MGVNRTWTTNPVTLGYAKLSLLQERPNYRNTRTFRSISLRCARVVYANRLKVGCVTLKLHLSFVVLAVICLFLTAACRGGGAARVNDFLEMLPRDAEGIVYVNTARLYDDDDWRDQYRSLADGWDNDDFSSDYGIRLRDLSYIATAEVDSEDVVVLGGLEEAYKDDLRDDLNNQDYDEDEIRGVEVWVDTSESWEAFAFLPNGSV